MKISSLIPQNRPLLILAPMQEITDAVFWSILTRYGGADLYFTEYFRVHRDSNPDRKIVQTIRENPTGKPVIAQMIGEHIPSLMRTAKELQKLPVLGIDLNLGCPAPVVCRKNAGGGLLKKPDHIRDILSALRETIQINFTVKTRIGFESPREFEKLLEIFAAANLDALTVHGRTVKDMYRAEVNIDTIARAAQIMPCPVFANGNIVSSSLALHIVQKTNVQGLMIGRGAVRNPWLFNQVREVFAGKKPIPPKLREVLEYVRILYEAKRIVGMKEIHHVAAIKKFLNYIAQGIGANDDFLQKIRRVKTERNFFFVCEEYLDNAVSLPLEIPFLINSGNPRV